MTLVTLPHGLETMPGCEGTGGMCEVYVYFTLRQRERERGKNTETEILANKLFREGGRVRCEVVNMFTPQVLAGPPNPTPMAASAGGRTLGEGRAWASLNCVGTVGLEKD